MVSVLKNYIAATTDENGMYQCFSCKNCEKRMSNCDERRCKQVKDKVNKCVNRLVAKMPNFNITDKMCGEDGVAVILTDGRKQRVIKVVVCVNDVRAHTRRYLIWQRASVHKVGPRILSGEFCSFSDFGVSLIQMAYWGRCNESVQTDAHKIIKLIRRTSKAGLLHIDPHNDNVRCGPYNAIFIDWEDAISMHPKYCEVGQYLMLCRMFVDSKVAVENIYRREIQTFNAEVVEKANKFLGKIKNKHARLTFSVALFESKHKMLSTTMLGVYKDARSPLAMLSSNGPHR